MELPVIAFIQARLAEADPNFETRAGSAHYDLFVIPQQFMLQPLNDFMTKRRVAQSVRQMLLDPTPDDPTTFQSSDVDDLASNLFVTRDVGDIAKTTVRVFYITAKDLEFPALTAQFTSGDLNFFNSSDFTITAAAMALQTDGSLLYVDIPVQAEQAGDDYNVEADTITAILNDPDAVRVTNLFKAQGGLPTESNSELLARIPNSIGVRDLETTKGINAILGDKFPFLQQIVSIGAGDQEMQRDIIYNIHTLGKTDVYLKTPALTAGEDTFIGLETDTTRELARDLHIEMAKSQDDTELPASTGTPSIVVGSVVVKEDVIDTSATLTSVVVPPSTGIDLSTKQWVRLRIDGGDYHQIKVSGATPASTQLFEIISAINLGLGLELLEETTSSHKFVITSPTAGDDSSIEFTAPVAPVDPSNNAAELLFDLTSGDFPLTETGTGAVVYVETIDYNVDYASGDIFQTTFDIGRGVDRETITSGQTMISEGDDTGLIVLDTGTYYLDGSGPGVFDTKPLIFVRVGDEVTITSIDGTTTGTVKGVPLPSTYTVGTVVSDERLELIDFPANAASSNVLYEIKSSQVVRVDYTYNPISIDIGPQVLLNSGLTRGVREGRSDFTIKNVPFVKITSIQEVDPDTQELIGDPLVPPKGFGGGGFGAGGFGVGLGGDYDFVVNVPVDRFSVFEDSVIVFNQSALTKSYRVSYLYNPELKAIHTLTRTDTERVTGADVLVKTFVPAFVDIALVVRKDPTNLTIPSNDQLAVLVQALVNSVNAPDGITSTSIDTLLKAQGVTSVKVPFLMSATVYNPDGTTSIVESEDVLTIPDVELDSQTDNFTTPKIVHFWPGTITVEEE